MFFNLVWEKKIDTWLMNDDGETTVHGYMDIYHHPWSSKLVLCKGRNIMVE